MKYFLLVVTLFVASLSVSQSKPETPAEQTSFCADQGSGDGDLKPTRLPRIVLNTVMNTEDGREAREFAKEKGETLRPEKFLKGSRIHLTDSTDTIFIVVGYAPMSGADNNWFWIVRQSRNQARILLRVGANCIEVRQTSTSGYRDIVTWWSSASTTVNEMYKYDGSSYKRRDLASHSR